MELLKALADLLVHLLILLALGAAYLTFIILVVWPRISHHFTPTIPMQQTVNVKFDWAESFPMHNGKSYELTVMIGKVLVKRVRLFPDHRGFYDGNEVPVVFTPDLTQAKKRIEQQVLTALK